MTSFYASAPTQIVVKLTKISIDIAKIFANINSMSAEQFLKDLPTREETSITSVALPVSLVEFLDEVAAARKISRSAVLRAILIQMKESWGQMSPAQKRGAHEA